VFCVSFWNSSMNTTPFMDKQIMDLTHGSSPAQQPSKDFIDLMKHEPPQQHHHHHHREEDDDEEEEEKARGNGISKDDIVPSYDFQPIRPLAASGYDSAPSFAAAFSRPWNSDSNSKVTFFRLPFCFQTPKLLSLTFLLIWVFCFLLLACGVFVEISCGCSIN